MGEMKVGGEEIQTVLEQRKRTGPLWRVGLEEGGMERAEKDLTGVTEVHRILQRNRLQLR